MVRVYCRPGPPGPLDPPGTHTLDGIFPDNCIARHCLTRSPVNSPSPSPNLQVSLNIDLFVFSPQSFIRLYYIIYQAPKNKGSSFKKNYIAAKIPTKDQACKPPDLKPTRTLDSVISRTSEPWNLRTFTCPDGKT